MISYHVVAAHILRSFATAAAEDELRAPSLDELTSELGIPRSAIRNALSSLHREGLIDVQRMRLTMSGLALATSLASARLAPLTARFAA